MMPNCATRWSAYWKKAASNALSAGSGNEALAILRSGCSADLLLTDIRMPGGMDGFALATAAKHLLPTLEMIYVSGWVEILPHQGSYPTGPLLTKPVRAEMLCRAAAQMLKLSRLPGDE
jgi:CheY-like chemotaxis protein